MVSDFLKQEFQELKNKYEGLILLSNENKIIGRIAFIEESSKILCQYDVEILIPEKYPVEIPKIKEISGKISNKFHTNKDGSLCLGTNLEVYHTFLKNRTLLGFVENLVEPYLYAHSYYQKYKEMPFGEFEHGTQGILQYYKNLFKIDDDIILLNMLFFISKYGFRGHHKCCCGSNKKFRDCHGKILREKGFDINKCKKIVMHDYLLCRKLILSS